MEGYREQKLVVACSLAIDSLGEFRDLIVNELDFHSEASILRGLQIPLKKQVSPGFQRFAFLLFAGDHNGHAGEPRLQYTRVFLVRWWAVRR